jgi:hypothetical protein
MSPNDPDPLESSVIYDAVEPNRGGLWPISSCAERGEAFACAEALRDLEEERE